MKSNAGATRQNTHARNQIDPCQRPVEMRKSRKERIIGLRVLEYNQLEASRRLSAIANGAPRPFKARLPTVMRAKTPLITMSVRPTSGGIGSADPGALCTVWMALKMAAPTGIMMR